MMDVPVLLVKQDFNSCYTSTQLASWDLKVGVLTAGAMLWTLSYIAPWTHFSELCMEGVGGAFSVLVLACETILYTAIDFSGSWLGTWSGHLSSALHENTAWCSVIYTSVGWLDFATAVFLTCLHACACAVPRMPCTRWVPQDTPATEPQCEDPWRSHPLQETSGVCMKDKEAVYSSGSVRLECI